MDAHESPDPPEQPAPDGVVSDRSLLRRCRGGSQDAATALYLRYAPRVRALVRARFSADLNRRADADDLVQSVFRRFFQKVCAGDYDVPEGEELWGLLLVISLNRIRSEQTYQRAGKRDVRRTGPGGDAVNQVPEPGRGDENALHVLQLTVEEVLTRLAPQQREMVELRVEGHEVADIARKLGRSRRTVERNLQQVRTKFRALLS
jgi:RNA polymerase sigma-70 factor (ECF subfamily)